MDAKYGTAHEGGWDAVLADVEGTNAEAPADAPRREGWGVLDALVDRSSGGDATGDRYALVVAQVGTFVPSDLRDAAETLLRVAGGASSWAGAVIDAVPSSPGVAGVPDSTVAPDVPSTPAPAGPEPETEAESPPAPERAPRTADTFPDDPTFEAAIAASPPAERP